MALIASGIGIRVGWVSAFGDVAIARLAEGTVGTVTTVNGVEEVFDNS